jgi:hypothetical protein
MHISNDRPAARSATNVQQEDDMAEQKTAQQQVREQFKVAETNAQNMLNVWDEAFFATTEWTFGVFQRGLRYNHELGSQSERVLNEALESYHSFYQDSFKSWQNYVKGVNEIGSRTL